MKKVFAVILFLVIAVGLFSLEINKELNVVAEQTDYKQTSTYNEVIDFLFAAQQQSKKIEILTLATSTEGRIIPLVVISQEGVKSPRELHLSGKPAVLIMANIHAGEVEGKEATLMLIRDFVSGKDSHWLDSQVVLILPIFNADGNDKLGNNRRDNGPELAGVRYNGQYLDLNRDYLKMESPEIKGLIQLFNHWDPVLIVDMHTTNGSYHQEPVTYTTLINPNGDMKLPDYMWKRFFPAVAQTLKQTYGHHSVPYGNFVDRTRPEKGWRNHAFLARYGSNYVGLRNRFTVLNENYSHADFKTRVQASYGFIKSILEYTHQHIGQMSSMAKAADLHTSANYSNGDFVLEYENQELFNLTVKSYQFKIEKIKPADRGKYPPWVKDYIAKKTGIKKDYRVPYFSKAVATRDLSLPGAYILQPRYDRIIGKLKDHGIIVHRVKERFRAPLEMYKITEIKTNPRIYQGHVFIELKGRYHLGQVEVPTGSYFITLKQPLARLLPVLLEPESEDSLAAWGYLNRELVSQWGSRPRVYPVYRFKGHELSIKCYQE